MTTRPRVGRLERTRFGYGFVRGGEGEDDLFIPPFAMGAALHGDLVVASFLETRREGDAHEIVEVLERGQSGIVGRIEPNQLATGVRHVVVNGAVTLRDGALTGDRAGQVLRRG